VLDEGETMQILALSVGQKSVDSKVVESHLVTSGPRSDDILSILIIVCHVWYFYLLVHIFLSLMSMMSVVVRVLAIKM
jgi:hypothetical protein